MPNNEECQPRIVDRRQSDKDCKSHERRMDLVDQELKKQEGWLKASAGFMSIAICVVGWFGTNIITKLSTIESLLNKNDVAIARLDVTIQGHEQRIKDIEARHTFLDQNGVVVRKGPK